MSWRETERKLPSVGFRVQELLLHESAVINTALGRLDSPFELVYVMGLFFDYVFSGVRADFLGIGYKI
jgi:hypothetical protein